jgi:hypothetical protein
MLVFYILYLTQGEKYTIYCYIYEKNKFFLLLFLNSVSAHHCCVYVELATNNC